MRELTCIGCPIGCALRVEVGEGGIAVRGNSCPRGEQYARSEVARPMRMLTSTIALEGGMIPRVPVRTAKEVPKERLLACMEEIHRARVTAPVHIGQVLIADCAGTAVDVIATRSIGKR